MKISIAYPPIKSEKGTPQLSQNRQFQWFSKHSVIYPVVPAYAATMLNEEDYEVIWHDGIAEKESYNEFLKKFEKNNPDMIAIETKTPVIKHHWRIIDDLKKIHPYCKTVLFGDHVTALPEESMKNSKVDYVLTGGDYDFLLLNLVNHLEKNEELEPGIWYREKEKVKNTGRFKLKHNLNNLPLINRELTKWRLYAYNNGNYKYTPGTYIMSGRDCWWGKCTFCSWPQMYPCFRTRKPENVVEEIEHLVDDYGIKEIMDDTGTFPAGKWLKKFCELMIKKGLNEKVRISCNMRYGILKKSDYELMRKAGFRFLLYGLESANQETLNKLDKGIEINDIIKGCRWAKEAGLSPHLTCMMGYPWENYEDAERTINLAREIFNKGWADTLQATIVIPYPGTPLYDECKEKDLLIYDGSDEWNHYDMREPVMESSLNIKETKKLTRELYKSFFTPSYIMNKLLSIRSREDIRFIWKGIKKVLKHLMNFS